MFSSVFNHFNKPYPFESSVLKRMQSAVVFSVFVFLFLYVFKPFGLATYPGATLWVFIGYGAMTFLGYLLVLVLFPLLFSSDTFGENWNLGKEFALVSLNILVIGALNVWFSHLVFGVQISLHAFWMFEFYTLAVGIIPVLIFLFFKEIQLRQAYQADSSKMNASLTNQKETASTETINSHFSWDEVSIPIEALRYFQSSANYVEIFFWSEMKLQRSVIRATLKDIEIQISHNKKFFRCHKSYLVNLKAIERVSGNAQGYRLHLADCEALIPVSRQHNELIRERLMD